MKSLLYQVHNFRKSYNFEDLTTKLLKSNDKINIYYSIYNPKTIKDRYEKL